MKEWIEILIRSVVLFFSTLVFIRIMGKRQISRINTFYFVNYVIIAILVALISSNIIKNLYFGLISLGSWILLSIALDYISLKSKLMHDLINGKETILIKNGKVMEESLNQLRLTPEELLRELRCKNIFNFSDVQYAVMENTGEINVLIKSDKKPITSHDLGNKVLPQTESQTVILDGNILDEPLGTMGLNRGWLKAKLDGMGISLDNVFIGQVDSSGDLYIDLFDDVIQIPKPQIKEILYANIEKIQADLMSFALETDDKKAKNMYSKNAEKIQELINKVEPYLLH